MEGIFDIKCRIAYILPYRNIQDDTRCRTLIGFDRNFHCIYIGTGDIYKVISGFHAYQDFPVKSNRFKIVIMLIEFAEIRYCSGILLPVLVLMDLYCAVPGG